MDMCDQEMDGNRLVFGYELITEGTDTCSGINDDLFAALKREFEAGGIPPVDIGTIPRYSNGTSGAPKSYFHDLPSLSGAA